MVASSNLPGTNLPQDSFSSNVSLIMARACGGHLAQAPVFPRSPSPRPFPCCFLGQRFLCNSSY